MKKIATVYEYCFYVVLNFNFLTKSKNISCDDCEENKFSKLHSINQTRTD